MKILTLHLQFQYFPFTIRSYNNNQMRYFTISEEKGDKFHVDEKNIHGYSGRSRINYLGRRFSICRTGSFCIRNQISCSPSTTNQVPH
ncbi:hypothetical protein JCM10914A_22910 [Paenibacillus sp. JCM 10914]